MNIELHNLFVDGGIPPLPGMSAVHSIHSPVAKTEGEQTKSKDSASVSSSSTPAAAPPLNPLKQEPPKPPQPTAKKSSHVSPEVKRHTRPALRDNHCSRSPLTSASDSDDDFVYILGSVKTTEEAVERIRAVQQTKERSLTTFFNGLPGSSTNLVDMANINTPLDKAQATPPKMKGGLPSTMKEFYECPRYTVSLTAAREAVFSDALSGFHSYVEREEEQRENLSALQRHRHHQEQRGHPHSHPPCQNPPPQNARTTTTKANVSGGTHDTLLSFSNVAIEEWNAALAALAPPQLSLPAALPSFSTFEAQDSPPAESASSPSNEVMSKRLKSASDAPPIDTPLTDGLTIGTDNCENSGEVHLQHLSAPYIFIMRSRDTDAMIPLSSPHGSPNGLDVGKISFREEGLVLSNKQFPAPEDPSQPTGAQHTDPNNADAAAPNIPPPLPPPASIGTAAASPSKPKSPVAPTPGPEQAAKLEEMQLQTLLQERIYQRFRVPVVFRCRYALEFAETLEEQKQRAQTRDRVVRHNERLAGPGGLSHIMRQRIYARYADPNTVAAEWPYVWEQFERDIPRETLFIEDTPHHDAQDALAAIMSYLEYCYNRGQHNIKERTEELLAASEKEGAESVETKEEAAKHDNAEPSDTASAPKSKGFFESILSASSAAIKGAVQTVRSSLPDFVGDPLLAISGLDPALYHASLLFPTDPKARSEIIFTAVREVVLASQQSFMGFPYQLLCEQVGTERLGLALEALELDNDEDGYHTEEEALAEAPQPQKLTCTEISAPIRIQHASDGDEEIKRGVPTTSFRSSLSSSRVVRIYQSFSSLPQPTDNADGRRHRRHVRHVTDEWNVSPSSSSSSHVSDVVCSPFSSKTAKSDKIHADLLEEPHGTVAVKEEEKNAGGVTRRAVALPPTLQNPDTNSLVSDRVNNASQPAASTTKKQSSASHKEKMAQRRRERRRCHRSQLPLLVGEPRPHEFAIFLDIVRDRVASKVKKEKKKREQERWHSAAGSRVGSRCTSSTSLDGMAKALFRDDVEGSTYLLPAQPAAAKAVATQVPASLLSLSSARLAMPPETRGMRICLFFDKTRNIPIVIVNKLFRLFTMPGVRGLTSSSEEEEEQERAILHTRNIVNGQHVAVNNARTGTFTEKSLLLLIQVQFSLFTKEEVEVRWKWWKV